MDIDPFSDADATILFGAGVTRAAGGPTAADLVVAIAESLLEDPERREWVAKNIQPYGPLRFEVAMDELAATADPQLEVLDVLRVLSPGELHLALAQAGARGVRLLTVNFDDLLEQVQRQIVDEAWTVDLRGGHNVDHQEHPAAVLKLHGTQRVHNGKAAPIELGSAALAATVSSIVEHRRDGLPELVEEAVRMVTAGRVLVVMGYSGSDDFDVLPSLRRCRPRRVIWIEHEEWSLRPIEIDRLRSPGAARLLIDWRNERVEVDARSGKTTEALDLLGWRAASVEGLAVPERSTDWRDGVRVWAKVARERLPKGLGWIAEMQTSLGLWPATAATLEKAEVSARPDSPWTEQRLRFLRAEAAYHNDAPPELVREKADAALLVATAAGDSDHISNCWHLIARTHRNADRPDFEAAEHALLKARNALDAEQSPGLKADLDLEEARLHLQSGRYQDALRLAREAAENAQLPLLSEALAVEAHALSLDWELDDAEETVQEALRIARLGPYPQREFDASLIAALVADNRGDNEGVATNARRALEMADQTEHRSEVAQAFLYLGFASSEAERYVEGAEAFARGMDALTDNQSSFAVEFACGLADCLLHLGGGDSAIRVLDEHAPAIEAEAHHRAHANAIRWRATHGTAADPKDFDPPDLGDAELTSEAALGLARLAAPSPEVAAYLDQAEDLLQEGAQHARLARLRRARAEGWQA